MKKRICFAMAALLLASMLVGCGESADLEHSSVPGATDLTGQPEMESTAPQPNTVPIPTETLQPAFPLEMYNGGLVSSVYSGVSADGCIYALPNLSSDVAEANRFNQWSTQVGLRYAYVEDGSAIISEDYLNGFRVAKGIIYTEYEKAKQQEFYNLYTGMLISKEDILKIYTFGSEDIVAFIKEKITNDYMYYAYESDAYTPEGLAQTLSDEHLETMNISLDYLGDITCRLNFLDADGNIIHWMNGQEDQTHVVLSSYEYATPISSKYNMDYRIVYKTRDGYHIDYPNGYDRVDEVAEIPDLDFNTPGAISIMRHMAEDVGSVYIENDNNVHTTRHLMTMAGQYLFIDLIVYLDDDSYQTFTYILDLLDGEEKTPEEIAAATFWNSAAMMDLLTKNVDKVYRQVCEGITGKPFEWEHDEELYQKTLSAENLSEYTVLPYHNGVIAYVNAYLPGSEQPVQMRIELELTPTYYESDQAYVDLLVLKSYPGLEEWIEGYNGKRAIASYLNYGAWEYCGNLLVGIGWFDENGQWVGYEAVSINTETGKMGNWEQILSMAGTTKEAFETELRAYLETLRGDTE